MIHYFYGTLQVGIGQTLCSFEHVSCFNSVTSSVVSHARRTLHDVSCVIKILLCTMNFHTLLSEQLTDLCLKCENRVDEKVQKN